jgi:hypothetical protein
MLARAVAEQIIAALGVVPEIPEQVIEPGDEHLLYFNPTSAQAFFEDR